MLNALQREIADAERDEEPRRLAPPQPDTAKLEIRPEHLDLIEQQHPDAVVLDLMMPVLPGLAAIPRIRACCPDCRIVVFSALSADQAEGDALSRGADAYVEKTRFVTELCDTLHRVCDPSAV